MISPESGVEHPKLKESVTTHPDRKTLEAFYSLGDDDAIPDILKPIIESSRDHLNDGCVECQQTLAKIEQEELDKQGMYKDANGLIHLK